MAFRLPERLQLFLANGSARIWLLNGEVATYLTGANVLIGWTQINPATLSLSLAHSLHCTSQLKHSQSVSKNKIHPSLFNMFLFWNVLDEPRRQEGNIFHVLCFVTSLRLLHFSKPISSALWEEVHTEELCLYNVLSLIIIIIIELLVSQQK